MLRGLGFIHCGVGAITGGRRHAVECVASIGMSRGEVWRHRWITVGRKIAIVRGLPGVGKTTLAARLAHDWGVLRAFPGSSPVLWASLGQKPDLKAVLIGWGEGLGIAGLVRRRMPRAQFHVLYILNEFFLPQ